MLLVGAAAGGILLRPDGGQPPRAVIVDQLSEQYPNADFERSVRELLEGGGYRVDYFAAAEVTVDLFRVLPARGYDVVLLRAHAGLLRSEGRADDVSIFTSEPYSESLYAEDQDAGLLSFAYYEWGGDLMFGIPAQFVRWGMDGRFDGATVVLMGCDTLRAQALAGAFIERGAGTVVGWDGAVSAEHTDRATERLLRHLVVDGLPADEAVAETMREEGPDPYFDSGLHLQTRGS